ncbi:MAG: nuclear transport factor 2 family protein [Sphingomonadaceae bacterium]
MIESADLAEAFCAAWAVAPGTRPDPARRIAFLAEKALVVADDLPFPLSRAAYADHWAFTLDNVERLDWQVHGLEARVHNESGIVAMNHAVRLKPRNAGFRLRAGTTIAVCSRTSRGWRALSVHMSPLTAQILDASPA